MQFSNNVICKIVAPLSPNDNIMRVEEGKQQLLKEQMRGVIVKSNNKVVTIREVVEIETINGNSIKIKRSVEPCPVNDKAVVSSQQPLEFESGDYFIHTLTAESLTSMLQNIEKKIQKDQDIVIEGNWEFQNTTTFNGLIRGKDVSFSGDCETLVVAGRYYGENLVNAPSNGKYFIDVSVSPASSDFVAHEYTNADTNEVYRRSKNSGGWTPTKQITFSEDLKETQATTIFLQAGMDIQKGRSVRLGVEGFPKVLTATGYTNDGTISYVQGNRIEVQSVDVSIKTVRFSARSTSGSLNAECKLYILDENNSPVFQKNVSISSSGAEIDVGGFNLTKNKTYYIGLERISGGYLEMDYHSDMSNATDDHLHITGMFSYQPANNTFSVTYTTRKRPVIIKYDAVTGEDKTKAYVSGNNGINSNEATFGKSSNVFLGVSTNGAVQGEGVSIATLGIVSGLTGLQVGDTYTLDNLSGYPEVDTSASGNKGEAIAIAEDKLFIRYNK